MTATTRTNRSTDPQAASPPLFAFGLMLASVVLIAGCAASNGPAVCEQRLVLAARGERIRELQARFADLDHLHHERAQGGGNTLAAVLAQLDALRRERDDVVRQGLGLKERAESAEAKATELSQRATELGTRLADLRKQAEFTAQVRDQVLVQLDQLRRQLWVLQAEHRVELKKLNDRLRELEQKTVRAADDKGRDATK